MVLTPDIQLKNQLNRKCEKCKRLMPLNNFLPINSPFVPSGRVAVCNDCLEEYLFENSFNWEVVDKVCRLVNIPFVPKEFERLHFTNGNKVFPIYAALFKEKTYESLDWKIYYEKFKELEESDMIEEEMPLLEDANAKKLAKLFGPNYDKEELLALDGLLKGLLKAQNVNGSLQMDQAIKLCKISLQIDSKIREGVEFDKLLKSYDTLVKIAGFTTKNAKNANDFESIGELCLWLEKRGWKNKFFDGVTKDIVDETINNIQNFNRRLYTNETGIGDEIEKRVSILKSANDLEQSNFYTEDEDVDFDNYDNDGFVELMEEEEEEFNEKI